MFLIQPLHVTQSCCLRHVYSQFNKTLENVNKYVHVSVSFALRAEAGPIVLSDRYEYSFIVYKLFYFNHQ